MKKVTNVPNLRFPGFTEEWETKRLGEISTNAMYGMNAAATDYDGENQYIRITDIDENTRLFHPNPLSSPNSELEDKYLLDKGDILFTRTGASVGKSYLYNEKDGKIFFAGFLIRFNIKIENPYFVFSQTLTEKYQKWVLTMSMRSGQPGINAEEYKSLAIAIPSIQEQEKISVLLNLLDQRIQTQNKIIEELSVLKSGVSKKIFSQELRFKDENGNYYCEWKNRILRDVGQVVTGKTPSTSDLDLWDGDIQFVTPTDISENKYQYSTERTIKKTEKLKILPLKSIMFTCIASIGKMSLSLKPCITNQQINSIIPNSDFNNEFVFYAVANISEFIKSTQSSSTMPIINKTEFSKFKIPVPSQKEQTKIANFLCSIDSKIDNENQLLQKLVEQKKFLLQNMFI